MYRRFDSYHNYKSFRFFSCSFMLFNVYFNFYYGVEIEIKGKTYTEDNKTNLTTFYNNKIYQSMFHWICYCIC